MLIYTYLNAAFDGDMHVRERMTRYSSLSYNVASLDVTLTHRRGVKWLCELRVRSFLNDAYCYNAMQTACGHWHRPREASSAGQGPGGRSMQVPRFSCFFRINYSSFFAVFAVAVRALFFPLEM